MVIEEKIGGMTEGTEEMIAEVVEIVAVVAEADIEGAEVDIEVVETGEDNVRAFEV